MPGKGRIQAPQASGLIAAGLPGFVLLVFFVLFIDQITKSLAVGSLSHVGTVPVISGIFHLTLVHNTGTAFGLFRGQSLPVSITTALIVVAVLFSILRQGHFQKTDVRLGFGLIVGGAIGNLIDRFRVGAVIDFLDFRVWPVFNVADSCITIGAVVIAWHFIRHR